VCVCACVCVRACVCQAMRQQWGVLVKELKEKEVPGDSALVYFFFILKIAPKGAQGKGGPRRFGTCIFFCFFRAGHLLYKGH